jgi:hypothetical protein
MPVEWDDARGFHYGNASLLCQVSQNPDGQQCHRQRDSKRTEDGPGYLSGVRDESDALSFEQEDCMRTREEVPPKGDLHTSQRKGASKVRDGCSATFAPNALQHIARAAFRGRAFCPAKSIVTADDRAARFCYASEEGRAIFQVVGGNNSLSGKGKVRQWVFSRGLSSG